MKIKGKIDNKIASHCSFEKNSIIFRINSKIYPLETILNTVYLYLDSVYAFLDGDPGKEIFVSLEGKRKMTLKELTSLFGEFNNELVNQLLRLKLTKSNKKIQEYIIGQALFSASLETAGNDINNHENGMEEDELNKMLERELKEIEAEEKELESQDDPLNILNSWSEKKPKVSKNKKK